MQKVDAFDLTSAPWIFALPVEEGRAQELSLRDVIARAHTLRELSNSSPLVTVGTMRLLLALLYRVCASDGLQTTFQDWDRVYTTGEFPLNALDAYLSRWRPRFDLFSKDYPFYQAAGLEIDAPKSLNCLSTELATGNNPTVFSHDTDGEMRIYTPAQAARLLVAVQSFALAGLLRAKGRMDGQEFYHGSAFNAAIPPGAAIWINGRTLFDTLMLNLLPQPTSRNDAPCWELDPPWKYRDREGLTKTSARGVMDRYTWQSRLILLLPDQANDTTIVRGCYLTQGRSADISPDPMHSYYTSDKKGSLIVRLSERKAAWRDAHAIFDCTSDASKPVGFRLVAKMIKQDLIKPSQRYQVHIAGIANDQAKVLLWRHDRMSIPAALLEDTTFETSLKTWMQWADSGEWLVGGKKRTGMARKLREAARDVARLYLSPGDRQPHKDDVARLTDALDPLGAYWPRLEHPFQLLLLRLGDAVDDPTKRAVATNEWAAAIEREAELAFRQSVEQGLGNSGRAIQAIARVRARMYLTIARDDLEPAQPTSLPDEDDANAAPTRKVAQPKAAL